MRSLLLIAACVALSGCLGLGGSESEPEAANDPGAETKAQKKAETESETKAEVQTVQASAADTRAAEASPAAQKSSVETGMDDRNCYTVDLFTDVKVEVPPEDLPERYTQYLGQWGNGAWNGVWCHDLLVHRIYPDGQVALVDMHAPYPPWNQPASAFRRFGWIDEEGKLHFNYGAEKATYEIVDGKMEGSRRVKGLGRLDIELQRRAKQPERVERSVRVAEAAPKPDG